MKVPLKIIYFFLSLVILPMSIASANDDIIKVAMGDYYPPFYKIENGTRVGLDVDIMNEVCSRAKIKCKINPEPFSKAIASIRFKKNDLIISGITANDFRRRVIDFSQPYVIESNHVAVNAKNVNTMMFCEDCPEQLDIGDEKINTFLIKALLKTFFGKKIGIKRGTISHRYFEKNTELSENITLELFESAEQMIKPLTEGKIDFALGLGEIILKENQSDDGPVTLIGPNIQGGFFGYGISIGLRKSDESLKTKVDQALTDMKSDGTLVKLVIKWFGVDLTPIKD